MYCFHFLLAATTLALSTLVEQGQSCHPPASSTSSLSELPNNVQSDTAIAEATSATTVATTAGTSSCTACTPDQLTTLTVTDAQASGFNGQIGPAAVSTATPTFTTGTDANGCNTVTTTCGTGQAAEIRVHLGTVPTAKDFGNAQVYSLVCTSNGEWRLANGSPDPFTPGLCTAEGNPPSGDLTNCIVEGWSCVTTTTTNGKK